MSEENLEVVRHAIDAFNDEGIEAALAHFNRKAKWVEPSDRSEGNLYKGHRGIRKLASIWGDNFDEHRLDLEQLIDVGDDAVVLVYQRGRIKDSSDTIERRIGYVWRVWRGKIDRVQAYSSWEAALDEVGLSEQDVHADS
jgi:ketosteroid isomerase-like protein